MAKLIQTIRNPLFEILRDVINRRGYFVNTMQEKVNANREFKEYLGRLNPLMAKAESEDEAIFLQDVYGRWILSLSHEADATSSVDFTDFVTNELCWGEYIGIDTSCNSDGGWSLTEPCQSFANSDKINRSKIRQGLTLENVEAELIKPLCALFPELTARAHESLEVPTHLMAPILTVMDSVGFRDSSSSPYYQNQYTAQSAFWFLRFTEVLGHLCLTVSQDNGGMRIWAYEREIPTTHYGPNFFPSRPHGPSFNREVPMPQQRPIFR